MLPSARLFLLLTVPLLLVATGVVAPFLIPVGAALFVALLLLAAVDGVRAGTPVIEAEREWPELLVQGQSTTATLVLRMAPHRGTTLALHETLHPSLVEEPYRQTVLFPASGVETRSEFAVELLPRRRGDHRVGPLTARILGPWGLGWRQRVLLSEATLRVYPQVRWGGRVGQMLRLAQRNALGALSLTRTGDSGEPYSLRRFVGGDSLSQVHWKATARRGHLVIRENSLERGSPLVLLLDCGRAMASLERGRSKLDHVLAASLALARVATSRGDRVHVVAFSDRVERRLAVGAGRAGIARAYGSLYDLEARLVEPSFDLATESVLQLGLARATVVTFTSVVDLGAAPALLEALQRLERRHRVVLLNLEDPVIRRLAMGVPESQAEVFAKVASLDILSANRRLGHRLRRSGIRTVSTSADRLALETLESYLALLIGRRAA